MPGSILKTFLYVINLHKQPFGVLKGYVMVVQERLNNLLKVTLMLSRKMILFQSLLGFIFQEKNVLSFISLVYEW